MDAGAGARGRRRRRSRHRLTPPSRDTGLQTERTFGGVRGRLEVGPTTCLPFLCVFGRRVVARLWDLLAEVRDAASGFEADRWSGEDCARFTSELARAAKACDAAAARAAARAVECNQGDVEWVARTIGATPSQARESLTTTAALGSCPATSEAVADGSVSLTEAREIVARRRRGTGLRSGAARGRGFERDDRTACRVTSGRARVDRSRRAPSSTVGSAIPPSLGRR